MTRRSPLLLPVALLLVVVTACSGGDDDASPAVTPSPAATSAPAGPTLPPFPTRGPQPSPTPVAGHEPGTRTGVEVVDATLAALEARDVAALVALLSFHPYRCNAAPAGTFGSNPCPPGVSEGAPVQVIAAGGCEVVFLARERASFELDIQTYIEATTGQSLFAVTEVQEGRLLSPLPLKYLIILTGGHSLLLDDVGVTHLATPCEGVGAADLFHPADTAILAPP